MTTTNTKVEYRVKTHGALFKGEMMLRLLDGSKTQTRRLRGLEEVNKEPDAWSITWQGIEETTGKWTVQFDRHRVSSCLRAPWSAGDEIYSKETHLPTAKGVMYRADYSGFDAAGIGGLYGGWKPSIFQKQIHSRYRARITQVRCHRLQDITEADAKAEGISLGTLDRACFHRMYAMAYARLWDSINGPGSWDRNPWVFAYTLERIK